MRVFLYKHSFFIYSNLKSNSCKRLSCNRFKGTGVKLGCCLTFKKAFSTKPTQINLNI